MGLLIVIGCIIAFPMIFCLFTNSGNARRYYRNPIAYDYENEDWRDL